MKRKISMFIVITLAVTYMWCGLGADVQAAVQPTQSDAPDIAAASGIVVDAGTGYIYYQKNMHKQMYPASITKIMTGILAVEKGKDTDKITVPADIAKGMPSNAARIGFVPGEKITQQEALYTMFLRSANDSANLLALHIGGTIKKFVAMMNKRAKELGAVNTHFANANGLPDAKNVTSAYDMALFTKKAIEEPKLMKYFGATLYTMPATNKHPRAIYGTLHKMMMKNSYYRYSGVIAGKTGWETMSKSTLVTVAKRNGRTLICVLMKSASGHLIYSDTINLLNYCFELPSSTMSSEISANYLVSPAKAKAHVPSKKPEVMTKKEKKTENTDTAGTGSNIAAPLLLLAFSVCLFAFLALCSRKTKRSRRNVHRNVRSNIRGRSTD